MEITPQEKAIEAIRKLKETKFRISADVAKKQRVIAEIDKMLATFKKIVEDRMRLKGTLTGGAKLKDLVDELVKKVETYLDEIDKIDNSNSNSEIELSTTFADSASDDVNIAIEELGKEIANMSGGKKRKMTKTKKINKKSKKTKEINQKTTKINKKSRKH